MKKQQQLSSLHPSINIARGREKKDLIDSMNIIRLLSRFEATLQEVLYHPVVPLNSRATLSNRKAVVALLSQHQMVVLVVGNIHQIQLPLPILQPHLLQQLLGYKKISYKADLQAHCNSLCYGFHLRFEDAQAALK